jgi:hypothetical protein
MAIETRGPTTALLFTVMLATATFAGCVGDGSDEGTDARFASYDEARDAVVETYEPVNSTSPVRLGLIQPDNPEKIGSGSTDVVVLLFDSEADEPVTDAQFVLNARMPAMGHGTDPETNPTHDAHGVYVGSTTLGMGGTWELNLDPTLADGTALEFDVTAQVEGEDGGGMNDGDENETDEPTGPTTRFNSYEEAKNADGRVYEPVGEASQRLKLIDPDDPADVPVGERDVTALVFDEEADEPVENASLAVSLSKEDAGSAQSPGLEYADYGVYKASTELPEKGNWTMEVTVPPQEGDETTYEIELDVGNVSNTWGSEGPLFEPYTETFEDTFQESALDPTTTQYDKNWTFDVKAQGAVLDVNITLENGTTDVTELNVTLFDAGNNSLANAQLAGETDEAAIEVDDAPTAGEYRFRVTGQGVTGEYVIEVIVSPPG